MMEKTEEDTISVHPLSVIQHTDFYSLEEQGATKKLQSGRDVITVMSSWHS